MSGYWSYDGAFPLVVLADDETVRSAGDGTGDAIITLGNGMEVRVMVGQFVTGPPFGQVVSRWNDLSGSGTTPPAEGEQ